MQYYDASSEHFLQLVKDYKMPAYIKNIVEEESWRTQQKQVN